MMQKMMMHDNYVSGLMMVENNDDMDDNINNDDG